MTAAEKAYDEEASSLKFKEDPRILSWIGASVIPKLDSSRDMFIQKTKYLRGRGDKWLPNYNV